MSGEAVASTPGTELEGRVVGDGSIVVPARAGVLGTCSWRAAEGHVSKPVGLVVKPEKPLVVCW